MPDSLKTITTSAKRFFTGTLLSRITGLIREIAMAAAFGTVPAVAAFWMAFRFANLLRRMLGEGSFHAAFIPQFEEIRKDDHKKGVQFFHEVKRGLTTLLIFLVIVSELILAAIYSLSNMNEEAVQVIKLTMIMLPAILFICLYGLNAAYLNCERSFFIPSVAPTALNIVWILAIFCVWGFEREKAITTLSFFIVIAFGAQWLMTVPLIKSLTTIKETSSSGIKAFFYLMKPLFLGMCGVAATQINSAVDSIFARIADMEGPAFLWYALRLQQLPLALFGVALTGAILPPISRAIQQRDFEKYFNFLHYSIKKSMAFMVPATFFFMATSLALVNTVYGHGEFSSQATYEVSYCLMAYAAALLPMTLVLILGASYYASQNWKIPTLLSLIAVLLNVAFNSIAVFYLKWGAISIALATSLATLINCLLLMYFLQKEGRLVRTKRESLSLAANFSKIMIASLISFGVVKMVRMILLDSDLPRDLFRQSTTFMIEAGIFVLSLLIQAKLFKIEEILALIPQRIRMWGRKKQGVQNRLSN